MHCQHKAWVCGGGLFWNEQEPTNPGHTSDGDPRGDSKKQGFSKAKCRGLHKLFYKSIIVGHEGQYHGCHQVKVEWQ